MIYVILFRLGAEILDFCEFLSPTAEEQESRNAAIKSVFDVINYIWPNAVVHRLECICLHVNGFCLGEWCISSVS